MAFITNYTLNKLLRNFNGGEKISNEKFIQEIFTDSRLFFFFNKLEINYLYNYKKFLEDEVGFAAYFKQVPPVQDTQTYINEYTSNLTYHLEDNCPHLVKDFLGFKIPLDVKEAKKVKELRLWFREYNFVRMYLDGKITPSQIIFKYNTSFAKKYNLKILNEGYKLIDEREYSGCSDIEESLFDFIKFKKEIDNIVNDIYGLITTEELERISKFDWLINKNEKEINQKLKETFGNNIYNKYKLSELIYFWKKFYQLKMKIMKLLLSYFKWTYKIDKKVYDVITLENFGMTLCSACNKKRATQIMIHNNVITN